MSLPFHETFTAADQDLSTYDANWIDMFDTTDKLRFIGNACAAGATAQDIYSYWTGDAFTDDQCCQAVIGGATSNYVSLVVRAAGTVGAGTAQGYNWYPSLGLVHKIGSTGTNTQINTTFGTTAVVGDTVKLTIVGTTISCYINESLVGTCTDATYTSGSPGLGISGASGATLDEWYGNNGTNPTSGGGGGSPASGGAYIIFRKA